MLVQWPTVCARGGQQESHKLSGTATKACPAEPARLLRVCPGTAFSRGLMLRNSSGSVGTPLLRNLPARCIWRCFPLAGCGRACSRSRAGSRCNRELARVGVTLELLRQEYLDGAVGPSKRRLAMTGSTAIMVTSPAALSRVGRKPAAASAGRFGGHRCRCLYSCLAGLAHAGCPAVQQVCVGRGDAEYAAGVVAARACGDMCILRRHGPADHPRQLKPGLPLIRAGAKSSSTSIARGGLDEYRERRA